MKISIGKLKKILKESINRKELTHDEVRAQFPGAIENLETDEVGVEQLAHMDTMPDGTEFPYIQFYVDDSGRLLKSNYEIGWIGWSEWDAQAQDWFDADDVNDEETQQGT